MTQVETVILDHISCELCNAEGTVLSGFDILSCPICTTVEVKNEFDCIDVSGLSPKALRSLMDLGWEIRDASSALKQSGGQVSNADELLRERSRRSAEAADIDHAALHSEIDKKSKQSFDEEVLKNGIMENNADILWNLEYPNTVFQKSFSSLEALERWLSGSVRTCSELLIKYFKLRMQAFKWYKQTSDKYFKSRDAAVFRSSELPYVLEQLTAEIEEALFTLGSTAFISFDLDPEVEVYEIKKNIVTVDLSQE